MAHEPPVLRVGRLLPGPDVGASPPPGAELTEVLLARADLRIERIVSHGHVTPPGEWYDQAEDEFVLLVSGAAHLELAGGEHLALAAGEWVLLPAHLRHRVTWTDPQQPSVWLAVFLPPER